MGIRNYLIEGVSGTGKTAVAAELEQRGYHVVHGDRELAYMGDPQTGEPVNDATKEQNLPNAAFEHDHHLWDVGKVRSLTADRSRPISFFCGGSRNFRQFIGLFDDVFVLDVDPHTLTIRLSGRPEDEFGGKPAERGLIMRMHATKEDLPRNATLIDATAPLVAVVEDILEKCGEGGRTPAWTPFVVRRLGSGDLVSARALNALFAVAFDDSESYARKPPDDAYLATLLGKDHVVVLVAMAGEDVVAGLVAYELEKLEQARSEIYIYDLAVAAAHRRRGIAQALIARLGEIAAARGAWMIFVQADYGDDPAVALYTKLGTREDVMHFDIAP